MINQNLPIEKILSIGEKIPPIIVNGTYTINNNSIIIGEKDQNLIIPIDVKIIEEVKKAGYVQVSAKIPVDNYEFKAETYSALNEVFPVSRDKKVIESLKKELIVAPTYILKYFNRLPVNLLKFITKAGTAFISGVYDWAAVSNRNTYDCELSEDKEEAIIFIVNGDGVNYIGHILGKEKISDIIYNLQKLHFHEIEIGVPETSWKAIGDETKIIMQQMV